MSEEENNSRLPNLPALPKVEQIARDLCEKAKATPEQVELVVWLREEAARRSLTTYAAIGKLINRDATVVSRVMAGTYPADLSPVCNAIRALRNEIASYNPDEEPFVPELSVVSDIVPFCDMARATQQVGMIWGENQSGKSTALEHYAATHADTVLLRIPAGGGTNKTMEALATACGISARKDNEELRERIIKRFTRTSLLIVDEFHQAVNGRSIRMVTVDRIREVHDLAKCGIVLCGTNVVLDMINDPRFRRFLGQIDNRGALRMNIPKAPTKKDRDLLFDAYGLPRPTAETAKVVKDICDNNGIARLTDLFKIARRLAVKKGEALGWQHFTLTITTLKAWSSGVRAKEMEGNE